MPSPEGSEFDQKAGGVVSVLSWTNGYVRRQRAV